MLQGIQNSERSMRGWCILQPLWMATRWQVEWRRLLKYGSSRIDSNVIYGSLIFGLGCGRDITLSQNLAKQATVSSCEQKVKLIENAGQDSEDVKGSVESMSPARCRAFKSKPCFQYNIFRLHSPQHEIPYTTSVWLCVGSGLLCRALASGNSNMLSVPDILPSSWSLFFIFIYPGIGYCDFVGNLSFCWSICPYTSSQSRLSVLDAFTNEFNDFLILNIKSLKKGKPFRIYKIRF